MRNYELNARIAMKLYPNRTIHRNGEEISCAGKKIDFRLPHLMERLMHEIGDMDIRLKEDNFSVNNWEADTLSKAVAIAYINKEY